MTASDDPQRNELIAMMRELLSDNYTHLQVKRVTIEEDLERGQSSVSCEVIDEASQETFVITGGGAGPIDAFFHAMVERFATEYPSLKTIRFVSFAVTARLDTKKAFSGTDSEGEVTLVIENSEGKPFSFRHASRSVLSSGIITTLLGLEYFINSERAFVTLYHAIKDARERNRSDLVQLYANKMAILVQNTSYSEVISKLRQELG